MSVPVPVDAATHPVRDEVDALWRAAEQLAADGADAHPLARAALHREALRVGPGEQTRAPPLDVLQRAHREALWQRSGEEARRSRRQALVVCATALGLGLLAVLGGKAALAVTRPEDLAEGKPRTQSSALANCPVERGLCTGARVRLAFATNHERNPWYQIDLGGPTEFSRLTVVNRSDMLPERAVPLVVLVSDDGVTYRQVARRDEVFSTWRAELGPQRARFVKLMVDGTTYFHLDAVRVHR